MRTVKLLPNNKKLKFKIKQFGEVWEMISMHPQNVLCLDGDLGCLVKSLDGKDTRWIRVTDFTPCD